MGRFSGVELDNLDEVALVGDRVTLRPWGIRDAEYVHEQLQDPLLARYLADIPNPYTAADAADYVTLIGQEERHAGTGMACAVVERSSGALLGAAELRLPKPGRRWADVGYWIGAPARGNGYAADATRLLADWAFEHGVHRLELHTDIDNIASVRTALTAGFRYDGTRRSALGPSDDAHDLADFGRLATDSGEPIPPAYPSLGEDGLSDGVLTVRCARVGDAVDWFEQESDELPLATGFSGTAPAMAEIRRKAARAALDWVLGNLLAMTVVDLETGAFAGAMQIRLSGPPQVGSIGYTVHPRFRGRGYTARALRLLVGWAFDVAGLARLELGAKAENVASQRAALSAGFAPDGVMAGRLRRPDGTFADEVRFALTNSRVS